MNTTRLRWPMQAGAFFRKEATEVLRQPRLLLTLVLGPFLIMAVFGLGYRETAPPLRTIFVVPAGSPFEADVEQYADEIGAYIDLRGTLDDEAMAERQLLDGEVDLVVVFPADPLADVMSGEQATITVIHTRLDPVEQVAISFAAEIGVDEVNGRVLSQLLGTAQDTVRPVLESAVSDVLGGVTGVGDDVSALADIDPTVLARPLAGEVRLAVDQPNGPTDWYAPAAVVLVIQQFGIAFGALSFVRERQLGIVEVLRVAPVGAGVTVVGKYAAYLLLGAVVGAALLALVVGLLEVPMASGLAPVAVVMVLTLFAAIGLGLLVSLVSRSDAQAVQYTMILLLASLFFSGFFLSANQMEGVARWVGLLLPVTYGMELLRDVMLRGTAPDPAVLGGLIGYGVVTLLMVLMAARRRVVGPA